MQRRAAWPRNTARKQLAKGLGPTLGMAGVACCNDVKLRPTRGGPRNAAVRMKSNICGVLGPCSRSARRGAFLQRRRNDPPRSPTSATPPRVHLKASVQVPRNANRHWLGSQAECPLGVCKPSQAVSLHRLRAFAGCEPSPALSLPRLRTENDNIGSLLSLHLARGIHNARFHVDTACEGPQCKRLGNTLCQTHRP